MIYPGHFTKIIELDELSPHDEPYIQLVRPGEYNHFGHVKTASEALDYIKHVKPIPGKTIILMLAMTAGEYYRPNRNGDAWPERPMQVGPTAIGEHEVLPEHYQSFENGHLFKFHLNKDPEKRIGDVLKAFYNWSMHRVELLLSLDNEKAEPFVNQIENGESPASSMGCFLAGNMITMGDGTRRPIEDIVVGDSVLTHLGRVKEVTRLHRRKYTGSVYTLEQCSGKDIECTEEHPFWGVRKREVQKCDAKGRRTYDPNPVVHPDWIHAGCLGDHVLLSPTLQQKETPSYVTEDFARLFGVYVADGHVVRNKKKDIQGFELNVNRHNPIVNDIRALCARLNTKNAPVINTHPVSDETTKIAVSDGKLASLFARLAGTKAINKKLDVSVMLWDTVYQRIMVGSYASCDGCAPKGMLSLSTASENLAWQLHTLMHRLNVSAATHSITHKAGTGFNNTDTTEWVVHAGKQWVNVFVGVCHKVKEQNVKVKRNDRVFTEHGLTTPLRSVTYTHVYDVDVYNFEVEDDESYVVNGVSAHNCKIPFDVCSACGNKAPTRKQYCDHAKYNLGNILPNGKWVKLWNPSPKFFDISMVRRPAEPIAFMMKKVAEHVHDIRSSAILGEQYEEMSQKAAALDKLSLIDKIVSGGAVASKEDNGETKVLENFSENIAKPAAQEMPPLDDNVIQYLVRFHPAEVLSTLSSMGIFMTTPEFIKYFIWKMMPGVDIPDNALARAVMLQGRVYDLLADNPDLMDEIKDVGIDKVSSAYVDNDLRGKLASAGLLEKRSQLGDYLHRHLVPEIFKGKSNKGNWDVITAVDPNTGRKYKTTRLAATQASDVAGKKQLQNLFGGGALLAGAAGAAALPIMPFRGLAAGALGVLGAKKMLHGYNAYPTAPTTEGGYVHTQSPRDYRYDPNFAGTELIEKRSHLEQNALIKHAMDYAHVCKTNLAASFFKNLNNATFDEAAFEIGRVIYP